MYQILKSPITYLVLIGMLVFFVVFCGIFLKFKNGLVSYVLYFLLLGVTGYCGYQMVLPNIVPTPDPTDPEKMLTKVLDIKAKGVILKRRIGKTRPLPLYGVSLPKDNVSLSNIKYFLTTAYPDMQFEVVYSDRVYGIVLYNLAGEDVNKELIKQGLVFINNDSPASYLAVMAMHDRPVTYSSWFSIFIVGCASISIILVNRRYLLGVNYAR